MSGGLTKAAVHGLAACHTCGRVAPVSLGCCPRCHSRLHLRKPDSIQRTIALMVAAAVLYIPSHLLPIMNAVELGDVTHHTIISGMLVFWREGSYPMAIVIFTASIVIPFLKIVGLSWLCAAATGRVRPSPAMLGKLYWFTELLGRWSMVDIFVVGIVVSLMQIGNYMTVKPGSGALAFAGVVVLTMFAAMSFEPRLLWDRLDEDRAVPPPEPAPPPP